MYILVSGLHLNDPNNLSPLHSGCTKNYFQLNKTKAEVLLIGPHCITEVLKHQLGSFTPRATLHDSSLTSEEQVKRVVQACFLQFRTISKVKSFLSFSDMEKVIHAFTFPHLTTASLCMPASVRSNFHGYNWFRILLPGF